MNNNMNFRRTRSFASVIRRREKRKFNFVLRSQRKIIRSLKRSNNYLRLELKNAEIRETNLHGRLNEANLAEDVLKNQWLQIIDKIRALHGPNSVFLPPEVIKTKNLSELQRNRFERIYMSGAPSYDRNLGRKFQKGARYLPPPEIQLEVHRTTMESIEISTQNHPELAQAAVHWIGSEGGRYYDRIAYMFSQEALKAMSERQLAGILAEVSLEVLIKLKKHMLVVDIKEGA